MEVEVGQVWRCKRDGREGTISKELRRVVRGYPAKMVQLWLLSDLKGTTRARAKIAEHTLLREWERVTAVSDPLLSAIIAASETSRLGPPTGVDAPRGCAPELYWRLRGVELVRATFYGRRAILGVAGDARCAGPIELEHVAHALNEAADRLAVRGLETIVVSGGGGTGGE